MDVVSTVRKFDQFLESRGERFDAIVIGGAALNVMSVISRETIDVDCLDPSIPESILKAAREFRDLYPELRLIEKWINNGPETLIRELETDWRKRIVTIFIGKAITFQTLGRLDLLKTKLFAYCDRDTDLKDCIALKPTLEELNQCVEWVSFRDANPMWPANVNAHFSELKRRLGYE